ncbi:hypothetical protein KSF_089760 [Reticulibacter mediterranei]|uniref:HTH luxR-type domain-containing protein n=1 Tax=Reticulibacter mediterranei TaxID=2778369 RepID=A0A8J3IRF3_9CHLR|nr:LuxR C-terminal-related transcriptional regulator [Reticulibacter mediterranei]GHO98928.1 hypothetical protein KSF_089760 [Reticulibacter mediterranei]
MPKRLTHTLIWSDENGAYCLQSPEQQPQLLTEEDEDAWFTWLATHSSFTFQGRTSRLSMLKEARSRGEGYWYAYHTLAGRTHKRYLGRNTRVTFMRLEEVAQMLRREAASTVLPPALPQHHFEPPSMLPLAKFSHPYLSSSLVARERLLTRLDAALHHRLTLLSASAGWGKTTLLSGWAAQASFPIAWLSLDEQENDPICFWVSVLAALRARLPEIGSAALAMLHSPQPSPLTTVLTALLNDLSTLTAPTILLLDDYHLIDEQAIHNSLLFLLEHLPAHLHLVLASRVDPPLALSRLRVRGHLLELRDADLRFLQEEAASFLTHTMGLTLEDSEITKLAHRTEGWIAGLQLAALSLQHHQDHAAFVDNFTGHHRYLLDYVQEEILARQPTLLQAFLLHISPLHRVTAPLCQAVTTEANSQALLETIERANLFLVPLDEERHWYRLHDLFREVLLARLQATQPEMISLLHQRAARWYEAQGMWRDAILYALDGKDYSYAARMMEQTAEKFWLCGETQTLYHWIMALPEVEIRDHARFVLNAALYVLNASASIHTTQRTQTRTQVEHMMGRVEAVLGPQRQGVLEAQDVALFRQRLSLLRLWSDAIEETSQSRHEAYYLIEQRMQHLSQEDEMIWQMIPLSVTFILHWTLLGEGTSLVQRFVDAKQRALQSGSRFATLKVMQWLAGISLRAGQLRQAHQECVTALDLIAQVDGYALLAGYLSYYRACVLYQWNQMDEARCVLKTLIHDAEIWQQIDLQIIGRLCLIDTELASGDHARAHQVLQQTQALIQSQGFSLHRLLLISTQVRYWLATGDHLQAVRWAAQATFSQDTWENERRGEVLMLVRVFLAQQQYQAARETLERFSEHLDHPENFETTTAFLALSVVALYQTGEREDARTALMRLLALTEREDNVRVFLDAGRRMRFPLQSFLNEAPNQAHAAPTTFRLFVSRLLTAFAQEEQTSALRIAVQPEDAQEQEQERRPASPSSPPVLLDPLTQQELRVLRLLVAGQTYDEMAQTLIVSRNTIKTQVSSIYRKLGVSRRAEAIVLAQRVALL